MKKMGLSEKDVDTRRAIYSTRKIQIHRTKLKNFKRTYFHQEAVNFMKWLIKKDINYLIIGKVKDLKHDLKQKAKDKTAKGKENVYGRHQKTRSDSQKISFGIFIETIKDKCNRNNIKAKDNFNEEYTSKASFIHLDKMKKGSKIQWRKN